MRPISDIFDSLVTILLIPIHIIGSIIPGIVHHLLLPLFFISTIVFAVVWKIESFVSLNFMTQIIYRNYEPVPAEKAVVFPGM